MCDEQYRQIVRQVNYQQVYQKRSNVHDLPIAVNSYLRKLSHMSDFPSTPKEADSSNEPAIAKLFADGYQPFSSKPVFKTEPSKPVRKEELLPVESNPEKFPRPTKPAKEDTQIPALPLHKKKGNPTVRTPKNKIQPGGRKPKYAKRGIRVGILLLILGLLGGISFAVYSLVTQKTVEPEALKAYDFSKADETAYTTAMDAVANTAGVSITDALGTGKEVCTLLYNGKISDDIESVIAQQTGLNKTTTEIIIAQSVAHLCPELGSVVSN